MPAGSPTEESRKPPMIIIVMGVSGTGKSTLGNALAKAVRMPYVEGDDLHPKANVEKMASGQPLDDEDREPWLLHLRSTAEREVIEQVEDSEPGNLKTRGVVVTCSSLKKYYRDILRGNRKTLSKEATHDQFERLPDRNKPATYFVFIDGRRDVLMERMKKRPGHFMKASMLDSQLNTLETPIGEEGVVVVSVEDSTEEQIRLAKEEIIKLSGANL